MVYYEMIRGIIIMKAQARLGFTSLILVQVRVHKAYTVARAK